MAVLVIHAHPGTPASRVNAALAAAARTVPGAFVHDLYEAYPHFFVDPHREQALLADHPIVVFQHPLYWYSVPALLKQWFDSVLTHGWAYGQGATALHGKVWAHALTTAGSAESYRGGLDPADERHPHANAFALTDYVKPWLQSARLCGMRWVEPFAVHSAEALDEPALAATCERYRAWLAGLA